MDTSQKRISLRLCKLYFSNNQTNIWFTLLFRIKTRSRKNDPHSGLGSSLCGSDKGPYSLMAFKRTQRSNRFPFPLVSSQMTDKSLNTVREMVEKTPLRSETTLLLLIEWPDSIKCLFSVYQITVYWGETFPFKYKLLTSVQHSVITQQGNSSGCNQM